MIKIRLQSQQCHAQRRWSAGSDQEVFRREWCSRLPRGACLVDFIFQSLTLIQLHPNPKSSHSPSIGEWTQRCLDFRIISRLFWQRLERVIQDQSKPVNPLGVEPLSTISNTNGCNRSCLQSCVRRYLVLRQYPGWEEWRELIRVFFSLSFFVILGSSSDDCEVCYLINFNTDFFFLVFWISPVRGQ